MTSQRNSRESKLLVEAWEPAYLRIERDLRQRICSGDWAVGMLLPGRRQLAKHYGVELNTLQRSISSLLEDGTLRTELSRGTFVARIPKVSSNNQASELNNIPLLDYEATYENSNDKVILSHQTGKQIKLSIVAPANYGDHRENWSLDVARSLERRIAQSGGICQTHCLDGFGLSGSGFGKQLCDMMNDGIDALVVIGVYEYPGLMEEMVAHLNLNSMPVILISSEDYNLPLTNIYYDSRHAGYQAAQHLLRTGRRPLLFIAPTDKSYDHAEWLEERIMAVRKAVRQAGLPSETLNVYRSNEVEYDDVQFRIIENHRFIAELFSGEQVLLPGYNSALAAFDKYGVFCETVASSQWGIIAANDATAYGVMTAASELGKVAGVDYALVGFDDLPYSAKIGLTSMRPPLEALGEEAARQIIRAVQGGKMETHIRIRSHLMARMSTQLGEPISDLRVN